VIDLSGSPVAGYLPEQAYRGAFKGKAQYGIKFYWQKEFTVKGKNDVDFLYISPLSFIYLTHHVREQLHYRYGWPRGGSSAPQKYMLTILKGFLTLK
jgi:hypothetical protein